MRPDPTLRRLAGRVVMAGFQGFHAPAESQVVRDLQDLGLAGVVLFDEHVSTASLERNIQSPEQLAALTRELRAVTPDLLIAIDQEGGAVVRLQQRTGFRDWPAAATLGAGAVEGTHRTALDLARTLRAVGVTLNFAPCVDLNINPRSPIIGRLGRSFGVDADRVTAHGRAFIAAHAAAGVGATLKHFPGHGSAAEDTHLQSVDIQQCFVDAELAPYRALHRDPGVAAVMVGHFHAGVDAEHPASLSRAWITGVLREQIGYTGVVVTDGMDMAALAGPYSLLERVTLALNAGVDLLLFGNNLLYDPQRPTQVVDAVVEAVVNGAVSLACLEAHARRVTRLRARLADGASPPGSRA